MRSLIKNNEAQSPIAILATVIVSVIFAMFTFYVLFNVLDGFNFIVTKVPMDLNPWAQDNMNRLWALYSIIFGIPAFFVIVLTVWAFKSIFRKYIYTKPSGVDQYEYQ